MGNANPGALTAIGTPVLKLLADLSAAVCVGSLAFAVLFTRPQRSGQVCAGAFAELRMAGASAWVWSASALTLVPFSAADTAGSPLTEVVVPGQLIGLLGALETPRAWLMTALVAVIVAVGCRAALRWVSALWLLVGAQFAVLPPLVTAHGSADAGHDLALAAIVIHVPAGMLWIGLLFAVLRQTRRGADLLPEQLRRYGWWANGCWLVLLITGGVLSAVFVPPAAVFTSAYGGALLVKVVVVAVLGIAGITLREHAKKDAAGKRTTRLIRFGVAEFAMLLGVLVVSVDLTHLPLPDFFGRARTTTQTLLGYDLAGPPTLSRLVLDWRIDVFFAPLALLLAVGYLLGVRRLRAQGRSWPVIRTGAWLAGCLALLVATSSGLGRYAAAMFSMHMASHMLVSMLVPLLLALGGPLTLVRAAASRTDGATLPRVRDVVDFLVHSALFRGMTHPVVTVALFAGAPFALYLTGIYDAAVRFHWAHLAINAFFLIVGYVFLGSVVGVDPMPRALPNIARVGMLLAAMPLDVVFGATLISTDRVIGNGAAASNMYQALALPWVPDLHADQRFAGLLALAIGELVLLVVLVALVARWSQLDDSPGESGLEGYRSIGDFNENRRVDFR